MGRSVSGFSFRAKVTKMLEMFDESTSCSPLIYKIQAVHGERMFNSPSSLIWITPLPTSHLKWGDLSLYALNF